MIVLDTHAWLWLVREGNLDIATWMATAPWYPADRIIYATARAHAAPIVTKERLLQDHDRGATVR